MKLIDRIKAGIASTKRDVEASIPGLDTPYVSPDKDLVAGHDDFWIAVSPAKAARVMDQGLAPIGMGFFLSYPYVYPTAEAAVANGKDGDTEMLKIDVSAVNPSAFIKADRVGGSEGAFAVFTSVPAQAFSRVEPELEVSGICSRV